MNTQLPSTDSGDGRESIVDNDDDVVDLADSSPSDREASLPLDVVFDLLSNERRRRVLRYLLEEAETTLGELAEHIASIENGKPVAELSSTERKRVYICLYQCHLPKLDDTNVIDFDEHRKTVQVAENLPQLTDHLPSDEPLDGRTRLDPASIVTLIALTGGLLVAQGLFLPNAWLSGLLVGGLLVSAAIVVMDGSPFRDITKAVPVLTNDAPD